MEFAEEMEGQRKNSKVYAIGDHLYCLEKKYKGLLIVKCTHYKKSCTEYRSLNRPIIEIYLNFMSQTRVIA